MVVLVEVVILGSLGKFGCKVFKQLYLPSLWKMIKENHLSYCTGPLGIGFLKLPAGKGFAKMVTVWFKELLGRTKAQGIGGVQFIVLSGLLQVLTREPHTHTCRSVFSDRPLSRRL